jgi:hypothetical protein
MFEDFNTELKRQWRANPLGVIGVGAAAVASVAKLVDALSHAQGRRAYAKQVQYRTKNKK